MLAMGEAPADLDVTFARPKVEVLAVRERLPPKPNAGARDQRRQARQARRAEEGAAEDANPEEERQGGGRRKRRREQAPGATPPQAPNWRKVPGKSLI